MANFKLLLPKMGESVAEATIIKWLKKPGDYIEVDEVIMEIATDKVDSEVPSPVAGKLVLQLCKEDEVVQVGSVVGVIETEAVVAVQETAEVKAPQPSVPVQQPVAPLATAPVAPVVAHPVSQTPPPVPQPLPVQETSAAPQVVPGIDQLENRPPVQYNETAKSSSRFYSPLVRQIASEEKIGVNELDQIPGTGADGRLTKDDLLSYIRVKQTAPVPAIKTEAIAQPAPTIAPAGPMETPSEPVIAAESSSTAEPAPLKEIEQPQIITPQSAEQPKPAAPEAPKVAHEESPKPVAEPAKAKPALSMSGGDEIIEMDRMRRLIADHMVMSKHTSPHVTSFIEVDVTSLVMWREKIKNEFEKRENEKITFTPIFIEAVVKAIKDKPMINISVSGTQIIKKAAINIGMATALPNGNLIVPVIKNADELNLLGLTKSVNDLAKRARIGKLLPDDVREGTFTITNVGTFGNVMGTPIINQPQVAILAIGAIKKKPAVIETEEGDVIAIRHMMFLSLSYDHRVVDGSLGGSFIRKVADYLENWDANRTV